MYMCYCLLKYFLFSGEYIQDAHMILKGHRSIVNQVRFNPSNHLIISSGVEKVIKVIVLLLLELRNRSMVNGVACFIN